MNRKSWLLILMLIMPLSRASAWQGIAAPPESSLAPSSAADPPAPATSATAGQPGELLLRTDHGELIPLQDLLGTSYSDVLNDLLQRSREQLSVPAFEVKQMELTGIVDGDVLRLSTELQIFVQRDHEWVTVPLAFNDMHITDFRHSAESVHARAVPETTDPARKQWHLLGAGRHTIRLELIGKARQQTPGLHTLALNLPRSTISHALIEFKVPVELQKLPADSVDSTVTADGGTKSVEFWGLSTGFSMSWADILPTVARNAVIQVQNRMKLDLTTIPVGLSGTQTLQISGSPVGELTVAFPPGFQLLELGAHNQTGESVLNSFDAQPSADGAVTTVRLTSPIEGTLTLTFDLELMARSFPMDVAVRLPVVRKANVQSGDLDILIPQGLLVQESLREAAQRKRVASAEADSDVSATAFRLRSTESRIAFHVEEFDAQFTIAPEMTFQPEAGNVLLTARFPVNVLRGSLLDLTIHWPGYTGGDWQILPGTTQLLTDKQAASLSMQPVDIDPDTFRLMFSDRQSGQFRVEFKAFAPIAALRTPAAKLICPEIDSRSREPIVIRTVESDEYSLQPINTETTRPLAPAPYPSTTSGPAGTERSARTWIHDPPAVPIRFELIPQAPSVSAAMLVGLTPVEAGIMVRQEIDYLIEHSDLLTLSLTVPEGIRPDVRIAGESEPLRATLDSATNWSFRLPRSQRGNLRIVVSYLWPMAFIANPSLQPDGSVLAAAADSKPNSEPTAVSAAAELNEESAARGHGLHTALSLQRFELPLVHPQPQASVVSRCEVGTSSSSGLRVQNMPRWQPVYSERHEAAWSAEGGVFSVPLEWQRSASFVSDDSPAFVLSRTTVTAAHAVTTTLFVFERRPRQFSVLLPESLMPKMIHVDGQSVAGGVYRETQNGMSRWTVRLPFDADKSASEAKEAGPATISFQTGESISRTSALAYSSEFVRPQLVSNAASTPSVWILEPGDNLRVVSTSRSQTTLTEFAASLLPSSRGAQSVDDQIRAILSPYPSGIQLLVRDQTERWTEMSIRRELFFLMADSGPLEVCLVPGVSLLLISAGVCALFFISMTILRARSLALPLLILVFVAPAMYLAFPNWTVVLLPYVLIGVLFGIVALTFQRLAGDRRLRLPGRSQHGDMLTVFGFSGFLADNSATGQSDVVSQSGQGVASAAPR